MIIYLIKHLVILELTKHLPVEDILLLERVNVSLDRERDQLIINTLTGTMELPISESSRQQLDYLLQQNSKYLFL